jgi:transcriptional regulator with XRE-family HTH domain
MAPRPLTASVGHALRILRTERRLSPEELGHRTGVHRNYIGTLERGEGRPTLPTIERLADGLGVRPSEIIVLAETLADRPQPRRPQSAGEEAHSASQFAMAEVEDPRCKRLGYPCVY